MIGLIKSVLGTTPDQCYHIYSCLKSTSTLCYTFQYTNILWFIQYHLFGIKIWPHVGYYRFLICFPPNVIENGLYIKHALFVLSSQVMI